MQEKQADRERELTLDEAQRFADLIEKFKPKNKAEAFDLIHLAEHAGFIFAVIGWTVDDARSILGEEAEGATDEDLADFLSNNRKHIEEAMSSAVNEALPVMWQMDREANEQSRIHDEAEMEPEPREGPPFDAATGTGMYDRDA